MKNLIGMYECKVDTKGRLMLPSGLKKQLAAEIQEVPVLCGPPQGAPASGGGGPAS